MPAFIDLLKPPHGPHFGRWTVLRRDARAAGRGAWWVCVCDPQRGGCGREKSINGQQLREGQSTQCRSCSGVGRRNRKPAYRAGEKVPGAKWTIKSGPRKADGLYACVCECGRIGLVQVSNLRNGRSTQCGSCRSEELEARKREGA